MLRSSILAQSAFEIIVMGIAYRLKAQDAGRLCERGQNRIAQNTQNT
jgi:hypothetical protein